MCPSHSVRAARERGPECFSSRVRAPPRPTLPRPGFFSFFFSFFFLFFNAKCYGRQFNFLSFLKI